MKAINTINWNVVAVSLSKFEAKNQPRLDPPSRRTTELATATMHRFIPKNIKFYLAPSQEWTLNKDWR